MRCENSSTIFLVSQIVNKVYVTTYLSVTISINFLLSWSAKESRILSEYKSSFHWNFFRFTKFWSSIEKSCWTFFPTAVLYFLALGRLLWWATHIIFRNHCFLNEIFFSYYISIAAPSSNYQIRSFQCLPPRSVEKIS